jgi:Flp pilus assembly protein TadD
MDLSDTSTRELTLDEAVAFAVVLQKNGRLVEARELFARVLEIAPDHSRALHYAGVLAHQQGRSVDAIVLVGRSLDGAEARIQISTGPLAGTCSSPCASSRNRSLMNRTAMGFRT